MTTLTLKPANITPRHQITFPNKPLSQTEINQNQKHEKKSPAFHLLGWNTVNTYGGVSFSSSSDTAPGYTPNLSTPHR